MPVRDARLARRGGAVLSMVAAAAVVSTATGSASSLAATPTITIGGSATAQVYAWGAATMTDGSVLLGDYWNLRIVHYAASGSQASPFVFAGKAGFGAGTNQAPFGICVDTSNGPERGRRLHDRGQPLQHQHVQPDGDVHHELGQQQGGPSRQLRLPVAVRGEPGQRQALHLQSVGQEHGDPRPGQPQHAGAVHLPGRAEHLHPATRARLRQRRQCLDRGPGTSPHRHL